MVKTKEYVVASCYFSPKTSHNVFDKGLREISSLLESQKGPIVVAGDFNAKAPAWGEKQHNKRGEILSDWAHELGLTPIIISGGDTLIRGNGSSKIDIALCNDAALEHLEDSTVLKDLTGSDHRYVLHSFKRTTEQINRNATVGRKLIKDNLKTKKAIKNWQAEAIQYRRSIYNLSPSITNEEKAMYIDAELTRLLTSLNKEQDNAPPPHLKNKTMNYWWNDRVASARREMTTWRRKLTRSNRKGKRGTELDNIKSSFKKARKHLKLEITKAKEEAWIKICESVDKDLWGKPYKIVTNKLRGGKNKTHIRLDKEEARVQIDKLFVTIPCPPPTLPTHHELRGGEEELDFCTIAFLEKEAKKLGTKKAAGLDGLTVPAIRSLVDIAGPHVCRLFNGAYEAEHFPDEWKNGKLIFIPKGGSTNETQALRPIVLVSNLAKLYEKCLNKEIWKAIGDEGLHRSQHGFRTAHSTTGAAVELMTKWDGAKRQGKHCLLLAFDVSNAFGSIKWTTILEAMHEKGVPEKLINNIARYLIGRKVTYETDQDQVTGEIFAGVPQGSVLGPTLWNIAYDGVLRLPYATGVEPIAYADDLVLFIAARNPLTLQDKARTAYDNVQVWMDSKGLKLATNKTEALILTARKKNKILGMSVHGTCVKTEGFLKYLGIKINPNRVFIDHVRSACEKAASFAAALRRITPNISGCSRKSRLAFYHVVESVILYAAPAWGEAANYDYPKKILRRTQKTALIGVVRAYRTTAWAALCVLAGITPIDLKIKERSNIFQAIKNSDRGEELKDRLKEIKKDTLQKWQLLWDNETSGRWTHTLIPKIEEWLETGPDIIDARIAQCLSGHGVFGNFLLKIKKFQYSDCLLCNAEFDSPEHAVFECTSTAEPRERFTQLHGTLNKENLRDKLLNKTSRNALTEYLRKVIGTREAKLRKYEEEDLFSGRPINLRSGRDTLPTSTLC